MVHPHRAYPMTIDKPGLPGARRTSGPVTAEQLRLNPLLCLLWHALSRTLDSLQLDPNMLSTPLPDMTLVSLQPEA